ncbi:NAD(P)H-binding protein [Cohnella sp. GCM10027633]|uniref:NAD(P)H-binding protein n=1 Tax=unclassified Cohnella TaxID=2636738 RepID=UPI0036402711
MHAIVIGATGATGQDLLDVLLQDDAVQRVDIFVRRDVNIQHPKLLVRVIDFDQPEQWGHLVKGDVLFSCLGTTLRAAESKEAQWKIDYDYQYRFARIARDNNVNKYVLVSSDFASPNARSFYPRMKGQLEEAVKALGFAHTTIFNPPLLIRKNTDRAGEVIGFKVIRLLNRLGLVRSQTPMPTVVLAQAMINSAKKNEHGIRKLRGKAIWERARVSGK